MVVSKEYAAMKTETTRSYVSWIAVLGYLVLCGLLWTAVYGG
jgi:hypothetical protein